MPRSEHIHCRTVYCIFNVPASMTRKLQQHYNKTTVTKMIINFIPSSSLKSFLASASVQLTFTASSTNPRASITLSMRSSYCISSKPILESRTSLNPKNTSALSYYYRPTPSSCSSIANSRMSASSLAQNRKLSIQTILTSFSPIKWYGSNFDWSKE